MPEKYYQKPIDSDALDSLVRRVLKKIPRPYPKDITDRVFLAIEGSPHLLSLYNLYANQNQPTTNKMIGKLVKHNTGLMPQGRCTHPKSTLIKSYTILVPAP